MTEEMIATLAAEWVAAGQDKAKLEQFCENFADAYLRSIGAQPYSEIHREEKWTGVVSSVA